MKTLDQIALKYGTDKSSLYHNYTYLYDIYFSPLRSEKLKILEIGIFKGDSLKTLKEYFPNAIISGIDIVNLSHLKEPRINISTGSQNDVDFLKKVNDEYGPFDIIIDDGSHENSDMDVSFETLFPLLSKGGLYIVEDLHCCYWAPTEPGVDPSFIAKLKHLIDYTNSYGKSGIADIRRDSEDHHYQTGGSPQLTLWESSIEFVHIYRSIVFIKKYNDFTKGGNQKNLLFFSNDSTPLTKNTKIAEFRRILRRKTRSGKVLFRSVRSDTSTINAVIVLNKIFLSKIRAKLKK